MYVPTANMMRRGQSALAFILLMGAIVALIGLTIAFFVISFLNSITAFHAANRASLAANGAVQDAVLRLVRDPRLGDLAPAQYVVPVSGISVAVTIDGNFFGDTPDANGNPAGTAKIRASATVGTSRRIVEAFAGFSRDTGLIRVLSWKQVVQ